MARHDASARGQQPGPRETRARGSAPARHPHGERGRHNDSRANSSQGPRADIRNVEAQHERAAQAARNAPRAFDAEQVAASPFTELGLHADLVQAVLSEGYTVPTPIQQQALPPVLAGRDLLGCAQTGTGKTAAFLLPMMQRLGSVRVPGRVRGLVLTPTRELAAQIGERANAYARHFGLTHVVIYGGVQQRDQERKLARKPDVLIATPGRLLDLVSQGLLDLGGVQVLVLDEADTMLDMGFIHDVRRIVALLPKQRQNLLFSATMPPAIESLAQNILVDPARVSVTPKVVAAETVQQAVYFVERTHKRSLLEKVLSAPDVERALVFTRTKHGADRLAKQLGATGIRARAIHGNKSQNARERALEEFRSGEANVLVATDIAARGIHVSNVSHVVNFDLPNVAENYVHRIGRTGRAGASGRAISFCDQEERAFLVDIERLLRKRIPVAHPADPSTHHAATGQAATPSA
ncbi:MAG TPA: DEAD/DEAH box helicase [Polyangiaceae bacterium]|nr:DEAD/DEAH box helicase [Polyangiaceae bacterium]